MRFTSSTVSFGIPNLTASTATNAIDCLTVFSVSFVISYTDAGLTGNFVGEGSNDGVIWVPVTGSVAVTSPANIEIPSSNKSFAAHRYYRVSLGWGSGAGNNSKVTVVTKGY